MSEPVVDPVWARPAGVGHAPTAPASPTIPLFDASAQLAKVALRLRYQDAVRLRAPLPNRRDAEFSCFAQNGEDGLLLLLFSVIGTTNGRAVEICAGDPEYRLDFTKQAYRCGASLAAFAALCRTRGYRLVGVQSLGFNAFFVRDDAGLEAFPGLEPGDRFARAPRLPRRNPGWLDLMLSGGAVWQEV